MAKQPHHLTGKAAVRVDGKRYSDKSETIQAEPNNVQALVAGGYLKEGEAPKPEAPAADETDAAAKAAEAEKAEAEQAKAAEAEKAKAAEAEKAKAAEAEKAKGKA